MNLILFLADFYGSPLYIIALILLLIASLGYLISLEHKYHGILRLFKEEEGDADSRMFKN